MLLLQEQSPLLLEDKCKWGECFIFLYDITDRYSFDELTRLKFIAYYTHSRLRLNFRPCWALIGNKCDLAENERMISYEEGKKLAKDLSCDLFLEISVKESWDDPKRVFTELWRAFSKKSPHSPSNSHRKKLSSRLQDKIPVLQSTFTLSLSERPLSPNILNSTVTSLKRQISGSKLVCKEVDSSSSTDGEFTPRTMEDITEAEAKPESEEEETTPPVSHQRHRRTAVGIPRLKESLIPGSSDGSKKLSLLRTLSGDPCNPRQRARSGQVTRRSLDCCRSFHSVPTDNQVINTDSYYSNCSSCSSETSICSDHKHSNENICDKQWNKACHFSASNHVYTRTTPIS